MDDIVLLAFVIDFDVLLVEGERGLGIIGKVEIQACTHFTLNARLYLLVKIEDIIVARTLGKGRVVDELVLETE